VVYEFHEQQRIANASPAVNPSLRTPSDQERSEKLHFPIRLVFEYFSAAGATSISARLLKAVPGFASS
jgi:hypothetical protein